MKKRIILAAGILCLTSVAVFAVDPATQPAATHPAKITPPPPAPTVQELKAADLHDKLIDAYMHDKYLDIPDILKSAVPYEIHMPAESRRDVEYIKTAVAQQRPTWWENTKSSSNISFQSVIWDRPVMTNFVPADDLGGDMPVDIQNGHMVTVVAWRPTNVDNPRPAEGALAEAHGITKGDIGEVIVWHELGHNYITSTLSADNATDLYKNHGLLFATLQEFFADMTALYHTSPHSRLAVMMLRLDLLDPPMHQKYRELEPHTRGSNAIGSMVLAEVLMDPKKWPSMHLPPEVPKSDIELKTIVYMYEHFDKNWTLAQDKALRDWTFKTVRTNGDAIFQSQGMIPLPQKNTFSLMEAQDRQFQAKRDAWVAQKLQAAIDAGLADKPAPPHAGRNDSDMQGQRIDIPEY